MIRSKMKPRLSLLMLALVLCGLSACQDDRDPEPVPTPEMPVLPAVPDGVEPDYASVKCDTPIFVSDGIRPEVKAGMQQFLTTFTTLDEAGVVVLKPEDIGIYEGKLLEAFNRGALIVVARPTGASFQDFTRRYGIFDTMPFDASQPVLLFATDNSKVSYTLYADGPTEGEAEDIYYKQRIFHFFRWVKQHRGKEAAVATTRAIDEEQQIIQNFEVQMNHEVCKSGSNSHSLNTTGSIDVSYNIRPAYAFEEEGAEAGDHYIVEAEVTAHNADFYRPYVTNGLTGNVVIAGYFMRELSLGAQLVGEKGAYLTEVSSDAGSTYTPENLTMELNQGTDADMNYSYEVENINFDIKPIGLDYLNEAIPQVAREDVTTHASWTWMVPAQTNGVGDCSKVRFNLRSVLNLQYGSFYYKLLGTSGQGNWGYTGIGSTVSITPPERRTPEVIEQENRQVLLTWPVEFAYVRGGDPLGLSSDESDSSIGDKWEVGDEIDVEYSHASGGGMRTTAKVLAIDPSTHEASVMVELDNPLERHLAAFYYPRTYWDESLGWKPEKTVWNSQKGTLDDLLENWNALLGFDYPKVSDDGKVSLPNGINMELERAAWRLSFTDGNRDISREIKKLEVIIITEKGGSRTYQITPEMPLDEFYVSINNGSVASVTFQAYTPDGVLVFSRPTITFEAGKLYTSLNVPLAPPTEGGPIDLAYKRTYEAQDGDVLTGQAHENAHITVAPGATITLQDAHITGLENSISNRWAGLSLLGDATLIIEGDNEVTPAYEAHPAIHVPVGSTLTIKGSGKLRATSRGGFFGKAAAIGGGSGISCGNIVIESGIIEAIAKGEGGAGIGAGTNRGNCGTITITGGHVTATGAKGGAGIGNGFGGLCGKVTITGGEVIATGNMGGAGIGATFGSEFGDITISGGIVKAVGGDSSPGIGYRGPGGSILITGGDVEAIGDGTAAAIGGSSSVAGSPCTITAITITDGVKRLRLVKGDGCPNYIGMGAIKYECGPVILDGVENPTPSNTYPHFESTTEGEVWTLLNHNR